MKIVKTITVNKPVQDVWKIIAEDFDKAHLWMGPIQHSYGLGEGDSDLGAPMEGRMCQLGSNPEGAQAREIITEYNEAEKRIAFEVTPVNNPAIVPLKRNTVQMSVKALGLDKTEVTWVSRPELKLFAYPLYPLLRLAIPVAFAKLLKGLKEYAEGIPAGAASAA